MSAPLKISPNWIRICAAICKESSTEMSRKSAKRDSETLCATHWSRSIPRQQDVWVRWKGGSLGLINNADILTILSVLLRMRPKCYRNSAQRSDWLPIHHQLLEATHSRSQDGGCNRWRSCAMSPRSDEPKGRFWFDCQLATDTNRAANLQSSVRTLSRLHPLVHIQGEHWSGWHDHYIKGELMARLFVSPELSRHPMGWQERVPVSEGTLPKLSATTITVGKSQLLLCTRVDVYYLYHHDYWYSALRYKLNILHCVSKTKLLSFLILRLLVKDVSWLIRVAGK